MKLALERADLHHKGHLRSSSSGDIELSGRRRAATGGRRSGPGSSRAALVFAHGSPPVSSAGRAHLSPPAGSFDFRLALGQRNWVAGVQVRAWPL